MHGVLLTGASNTLIVQNKEVRMSGLQIGIIAILVVLLIILLVARKKK